MRCQIDVECYDTVYRWRQSPILLLPSNVSLHNINVQTRWMETNQAFTNSRISSFEVIWGLSVVPLYQPVLASFLHMPA